MYRKYYLVEVVFLLLLSHGGWNGPSVTLLSCTSESSKLIRNVMHKQFLPVLSQYGVSLPMECPLHPKRDMFWWLQTDIEGAMDAFNCPVCGETFKCESRFVTHWDATHSKGLHQESVCLDDYCDVFRCQMLRQKKDRAKCPSNQWSAKSLTSTLHSKVVPTLPSLEQRCEAEQGKCCPEHMAQLQTKCRSIIRQCTIGMLYNLSSKEFQDLEEALDQALCSYLTCEKYWEDFHTQQRYVPIMISLVVSLIIFTGFGVCYYGTWLLVKKHTLNCVQLCSNCQRKTTSLNPVKKDKATGMTRIEKHRIPDRREFHYPNDIFVNKTENSSYPRIYPETKYREIHVQTRNNWH